MRKSFFIFIFFIGILFLNPSSVSAHILQFDESVGAVLHIDPNDDPIVGQSTNFYFEFKDKENKFDPAICDCKVSIADSSRELFRGDLFAGNPSPSLTNASFNFVFPAKDIYKLTVTGSPKTDGAFKDFKLTYEIRVARDSQDGNVQKNSSLDNNFIYILLFIVAIFAILFFVKSMKKRG